jgi:hypothetical protein
MANGSLNNLFDSAVQILSLENRAMYSAVRLAWFFSLSEPWRAAVGVSHHPALGSQRYCGNDFAP